MWESLCCSKLPRSAPQLTRAGAGVTDWGRGRWALALSSAPRPQHLPCAASGRCGATPVAGCLGVLARPGEIQVRRRITLIRGLSLPVARCRRRGQVARLRCAPGRGGGISCRGLESGTPAGERGTECGEDGRSAPAGAQVIRGPAPHRAAPGACALPGFLGEAPREPLSPPAPLSLGLVNARC